MAALLEGVYSTLVFVAAERMASRTRRKLFHNLLRQDAAFFDAHKAEDLVRTIKGDVALAQRSLGDHLFHGLHCLFNFSVAVFVMFAISWKMALVVLSLAPICVLVVRIQRFYARLLGRERAERLAKAAGFVRECLSSLRIVRSFAAEDRKTDE
ncbi:ABC transporter type 1, transmembrane domain-containing protein [Baffinella frigidus]|nr:ABC transporter type 1, transmembrane domain-containing protein [Cryptophyta sp. CCMP2293]